MNKAIEIKQKLLLNANRAKMVNVDTAMQIFVAELTAHKAKIDELKEWCKDHSRNTAATKYDRYWKGYQESAIFTLQKLEELDK